MADHFLASILDERRPCGLRLERTGEWLVSRLHLALDSAARRRGLLEHTSLDEHEGLVIAPSQGIHTIGMSFPIDVIGIARSGMVVRVRTAVPPRRIVLALRAFAIVELSAGRAGRVGLVVGDRIVAAALGGDGQRFRARL